MIGREKRVLLRHYLEQEMNGATIARDLGISRRTLSHWIKTGQRDRDLNEERLAYGRSSDDLHYRSSQSAGPCV